MLCMYCDWNVAEEGFMFCAGCLELVIEDDCA